MFSHSPTKMMNAMRYHPISQTWRLLLPVKISRRNPCLIHLITVMSVMENDKCWWVWYYIPMWHTSLSMIRYFRSYNIVIIIVIKIGHQFRSVSAVWQLISKCVLKNEHVTTNVLKLIQFQSILTELDWSFIQIILFVGYLKQTPYQT